MVNLTINGKQTQVAEGTTILDAAKAMHIHIPTLCYLKEINEVGACRVCLVEIEGQEGKDFLEADTVIYAAGMRAQRDDAIALSQCAPEFHMLGDCQTPKNIIAATQVAHTTAMLIGTK